jgi:hypothetical protein
VFFLICPSCRVYLSEKEEICPSCGYVLKEEHKKDEKKVSNSSLEFNYSGVPISKRVVSIPANGSKQAGYKFLFILLLLLPILNVFVALYGAFNSRDLLIRRLSQIVLVITFVVVTVFFINVYQYGMEFVIEKIVEILSKIR